jgi:hypothetical protein
MTKPLAEPLWGIVLLVAAALKSHQLFTGPVPPTAGLIHSRPILSVLIQSELLLALWLLIGGFNRARFICATTCFTLFAIVALYEAFHAMPSCGCFGNVKVPPAITAGFDIAAVIALWLTRKQPRNGSPSRWRITIGATAALALSAALWIGFALKQTPAASTATGSSADLVILDPSAWVNKPFPLFDQIDGSAPLKSGRWLLLFYHYDCDDCRQAIPAYRALAPGDAFRIAFIAMPPLAPAGQDPVADSTDHAHLSLRPDHDWFATTPVVAALQDGRVLAAADGEAAIHPPAIPQWR